MADLRAFELLSVLGDAASDIWVISRDSLVIYAAWAYIQSHTLALASPLPESWDLTPPSDCRVSPYAIDTQASSLHRILDATGVEWTAPFANCLSVNSIAQTV